MAANVTVLYTRDQPAWWDYSGLCTFDDAPTMSEAFRRYGLDYEVRKDPLYRHVRTGIIDSYGVEKERYQKAEGRYLMVRPPMPGDDRERELGTVGENYTPIQNMDIASVLDPITRGDDGQRPWPVEAVGVLGEGRKVIALLKAGTGAVQAKNHAGIFTVSDEIRHYFLVTDDKAGNGKLSIAYTPVRVECENTEILGLEMSDLKVQLQHTGNARERLDFCVTMMARVERGGSLRSSIEAVREATVGFFDRMAGHRLTADEAREVFEAAYPDPGQGSSDGAMLRNAFESDPELRSFVSTPADLATILDTTTGAVEAAISSMESWESRRDMQRALVDEASLLYEKFGDEHPAFGGTAWAAFNAVTELADWRKGTYRSGISALAGTRSKEKEKAAQALQLVMAGEPVV